MPLRWKWQVSLSSIPNWLQIMCINLPNTSNHRHYYGLKSYFVVCGIVSYHSVISTMMQASIYLILIFVYIVFCAPRLFYFKYYCKIASESKIVKSKKCKVMRIGWRMIKLVLLKQLIGPRKFCFGDIHTPIILQCFIEN